MFGSEIAGDLSDLPIRSHGDAEWNELTVGQQHVLSEGARFVVERI